MWTDWSGRISGILSFGFTAWATYSEWIAKQPKVILWVLAAISYLIASFSVWYSNHSDLTCEIIQTDASRDNKWSLPDDSPPYYFSINLYLANTRKEDSTIKSYRLIADIDGEKVEGDLVPAVSHSKDAVRDLNEIKYSPMKQSVPVEGWLRFAVRNLDFDIHMAHRKYVLIITDVYRRSYKLKGWFPSKLPNPTRKVSTSGYSLVGEGKKLTTSE